MAHKATSKMRCQRKTQAGATILMVVGVLAFLAAVMLGGIALYSASQASKHTSTTLDALARGETVILDYVRRNNALPSVAVFETLTVDVKDTWGNSLLYFPDNSLLAGDICAISPSNISLNHCGTSAACASPISTTNIPFILASSGETFNAPPNRLFQTTTYVNSSSISAPHTFRAYSLGASVGAYLTPTDSPAIYDDLLTAGNQNKIRTAAGCLTSTQGDIRVHGGALSLLVTSSALPDASCGIPYSKSLSAFGMSGAFSWNVLNLPAGLSYAASGVTSAISGTPTETTAGSIPIQVTVTDTAGRSNNRTYSLRVNDAWVDTGNTDASTCSASGSLSIKEQVNCSGATQWVTVADNACCNWSDNGVTQTIACDAGYTGTIEQKQQTNSCDSSTRWVSTSNTCVAAPPIVYATYIGRFSELFFEFPTGSYNSGEDSITIGTGTSSLTISATSNITRHSTTSSTPAVGVAGGASNAIDAGEEINFDFNNGFSRKLGIEFRGFDIQNSGTGPAEQLTLSFIDTTTSTTVGSYVLTACGTGPTTSYQFDLPDVGTPFNRVVVTANAAPVSNQFYVRGIAACDATAPSCLPSTSVVCPYP